MIVPPGFNPHHLYKYTHGPWEYGEVARLPMWVIYDHPSDWPDKFVARLHYSLPAPEPTEVALLADSLEDLREIFGRRLGRACVQRAAGDGPVIAETWL